MFYEGVTLWYPSCLSLRLQEDNEFVVCLTCVDIYLGLF